MEPVAQQLAEVDENRNQKVFRAMAKTLPSLGANVLSLFVFFAIWKIASNLFSNPLFPGPDVVARTFWVLVTRGDLQGITLLEHSYVSLFRVLLGFAAACLTAIPLGILLGLWKPLYTGTKSVSEPLRFIPPLAWIPLGILFFSGLGRYVFLIWIGTFFPLFVLTMNVVSNTPPLFVDVARACGGSRLFIVTRVVLPNALAQIVGGMRMVLGPAWMCIMAAEMVTAELIGLGQMIYNYATILRMDVVIVGMITIGLLGFALNEAFLRLEFFLFRHLPRARL
jgi:ABC-type nitrate/sulfonate/bicarbonate transport system permease component